jgi:hypothetical protein
MLWGASVSDRYASARRRGHDLLNGSRAESCRRTYPLIRNTNRPALQNQPVNFAPLGGGERHNCPPLLDLGAQLFQFCCDVRRLKWVEIFEILNVSVPF